MEESTRKLQHELKDDVAPHENNRQQDKAAAEQLDGLRKRILQFDDEHMDVMRRRGPETVEIAEVLAEEQISIFGLRPLLQRDRRSYEPLKADIVEFWPRMELMLIDMVPSSRDISVPGLAGAHEARTVNREILKKLFEKRNSSLEVGLDRLGPNAAQDLIPMVPALADARKGGRLNPRRLKIRQLTDDMMEALTKAFIEWPFRPSTLELELSASSGGAENAAGETLGVGDETE